ncbi:2-deoxyribose-5-phosphate aldolase, partial [Xanthomonas citri pv. citri]|nr:2-deoxyribose-5-phosphate aldolase [Xanthomonas citri pv. citri]
MKIDYNKMIDHTFLKAEATKADIDKLIAEAKQYGFKTVCVNSSYVPYVKEQLMDSNVGITSVIGFPLGAMLTNCK